MADTDIELGDDLSIDPMTLLKIGLRFASLAFDVLQRGQGEVTDDELQEILDEAGQDGQDLKESIRQFRERQSNS